MDINDITPQWLAGFFDGEGCINLSRNKYGGYSSLVNISQRNAEIIVLIMAKFPGGYINDKKGKNDTRESCFTLAWSNERAIPFLNFIKDYVILKKERVKLMLMYLNSKDSVDKEKMYDYIKEANNTKIENKEVIQ